MYSFTNMLLFMAKNAEYVILDAQIYSMGKIELSSTQGVEIFLEEP